MFRNLLLIIIAFMSACFCACIEDGFTTDPSDQPSFSVDTLKMGVVYTDELTTTQRFTVYNPHKKGINLQQVSLSGADANKFRINVDGQSGTIFRDMEIRANDSIFVFVSVQLPENGLDTPTLVEAAIDFRVNGITRTVPVTVEGQDIHRLRGAVIEADTLLTAGKPYQVKDSLVIEQGATLTLEAGTEIRFHDGAYMLVRGSLVTLGSAEAPIKLTGDRTGNVITDVSFDLMSRQWGGIVFDESSTGNFMAFTEVSNTSWGVHVYGPADSTLPDSCQLTLHNCRLHNSGDRVLTSLNGTVEALGCEMAEAANGILYLAGGKYRFDQCTVSNYYLFSVVSGAAWCFPDITKYDEFTSFHPTEALITNSITYGLGSDVDPGDLTGYNVTFNHCLFKSQGSDDENFIDILWDSDPMFYTVREDYVFDYRLRPDSPAIGAAYPALSDTILPTDFYGTPRAADLGAYVFVAPSEETQQ